MRRTNLTFLAPTAANREILRSKYESVSAFCRSWVCDAFPQGIVPMKFDEEGNLKHFDYINHKCIKEDPQPARIGPPGAMDLYGIDPELGDTLHLAKNCFNSRGIMPAPWTSEIISSISTPEFVEFRVAKDRGRTYFKMSHDDLHGPTIKDGKFIYTVDPSIPTQGKVEKLLKGVEIDELKIGYADIQKGDENVSLMHDGYPVNDWFGHTDLVTREAMLIAFKYMAGMTDLFAESDVKTFYLNVAKRFIETENEETLSDEVDAKLLVLKLSDEVTLRLFFQTRNK